MLTFKQYLFELFKQHVPFVWVSQQEDIWKAEFSVDKFKYEVILSWDDEDTPWKWSVVFSIINRPANVGLYDISGTGNAFIVFSTVQAIVLDFVNKNPQVKVIIFTAKEPSRQRFYDRWAKQIAADLGGWTLNILPRSVRKYILRRP